MNRLVKSVCLEPDYSKKSSLQFIIWWYVCLNYCVIDLYAFRHGRKSCLSGKVGLAKETIIDAGHGPLYYVVWKKYHYMGGE
jgi:hypothetical protein